MITTERHTYSVVAAGVSFVCGVLLACGSPPAQPAAGPSTADARDAAAPARVVDAGAPALDAASADAATIGYIGLLDVTAGENDPNAPDAPWRHDGGPDVPRKKGSKK